MTQPPPGRPAASSRSRAYTLVELVMVTALAVLLLSLAVTTYHAWTPRSSLAGSVATLRSELARARAYALTHGVEARFSAVRDASPRADATVLTYRPVGVTNGWQLLAATNVLPDWIRFEPDGPSSVVFAPDGACADDDLWESDQLWRRFVFHHANATRDASDARFVRGVEVNRLTGLNREAVAP